MEMNVNYLLALMGAVSQHEQTEAQAAAGLLTPEEDRRSLIIGAALADRVTDLPADETDRFESLVHFEQMAAALTRRDGVEHSNPCAYVREQHALLVWTEHDAR